MTSTTRSKPSKSKPVEKIVGAERVLTVLKELADHSEGISLDELTMSLKASKSTVHRALATILKSGLATKTARGNYILGDEFLRIANKFQSSRPEGRQFEPLLGELAARFGETAHYAVLDGADVVYRAKVDAPKGAVKLTSIIGGRNPATCTAVGKILLSYQVSSLKELSQWLGPNKLVKRTEKSITSPSDLFEELKVSRERGYGVDDQENEAGINCIAFPIFIDDATTPMGAVSISGLAFRTPLIDFLDSRSDIKRIVDKHLARISGEE